MRQSDLVHADVDSGGSDDPDSTGPLPKCQSKRKESYEAEPESGDDGSRAKQFDGQDDLSDSSQFHTPAQPSKRRRIPSPSPVKSNSSDGVERDDLFESPPSRKRGFRRPRNTWSLVQEWSLEPNERKDIDEEIENILKQSLADSEAKGYIKPNPNSIAGFRQKRVQSII
jgi:hypothetical protein